MQVSPLVCVSTEEEFAALRLGIVTLGLRTIATTSWLDMFHPWEEWLGSKKLSNQNTGDTGIGEGVCSKVNTFEVVIFAMRARDSNCARSRSHPGTRTVMRVL